MPGPFIGRDRELAELRSALQDAVDGRGGFFLLTGEAGIGKTALAGQLAAHAAERGLPVLWGRSWPVGGAPPYWTWTQIMRALVDTLDEATLHRVLPVDAAARIAPLVPEVADRFGEAAQPVWPPESEAGRFYVFEATSRLLRAAASVHPLVLVLDDLFSTDRGSLLLQFLARDVRASRLLVVATFRDTEAAHSPDLAEVLADLVREGHALRLGGLDRDQVGRVIAHVSGTEPWQGKVAAIHEATGGNPLFVREVTRMLAAVDPLDQPGRLRIRVPDSVRAVIHRRLAPLSADAVQVLSAAAVVGREFDLALLGSACDLPTDRVLGALFEAAAIGVVGERHGSLGRYGFAHPLMREVVYEGLSLPARIQMHQRVGEAIERLPDPDPTSRLAQLAHHFAQVAATGEAARAQKYAGRAGDQAMASCAYEEAAAQYRRALEASRFAGTDEAQRCELLLRLGGAHARAGDYRDAKDAFLQAAHIARTLNDADRLAQAALGFGEPQVEGGLVNQQLISLLREALDALGPRDSGLRARVLARCSLELTFSVEEKLRDSLSRDAVEMARRLGDAAVLAAACRARWMAVWGPDGLEERTALAEDILRLARDTGDPELELVGRARRITCSLESQDRRAVDDDIAAHARQAGQLRMPYHQWTATTMAAGQALLDGSLEPAEQLAARARSLLPERPNAAMAWLNQITAIRWEQGRLGELREPWQEMAQRFPQAGFARGWLSLADAELGRAEEARAALHRLVEQLADLPKNGLWLPALAIAALAAAHLDDSVAAATIYPLLLPYGGRAIVISMPHPVTCFGSASLYLGLLASLRRQWQDAGEHFGSALHANITLEAMPLAARTRYEHARMLTRSGRAADRRRALALLGEAAAAAQAIGMARLARDCARLRDLHAGAAVPTPESAATIPPEAGRGNVFRREGDYWTVTYDGSLVRLRDSKGLRHLARLLAEPGREFHVVDLEAAEGPGARPSPHWSGRRLQADDLQAPSDLGDAGELLDARAKAEYKARLDDLRAELEEAKAFNDPGRAARITEEIDFIAAELARAVGLGGRDRRAASHAERARLNVTRAIRAAMANLAHANPALGRHLSATIHTGRYCAYTPDPRADTGWQS